MSLQPLFDAAPEIQIHAFAAMAAFVLEGTLPHRTLGWVWVLLMLLVSASSFFIHGHSYRLWRTWSPIHILSVFTPVMLVLGVLAAHGHRVNAHRIGMMPIFAGALVIAGVFTLVPGRLMHTVVFGPQ